MPENFNVSGPSHLLTRLDWTNASHRRSIAASLVQGVYSLEHKRQRASINLELDTQASMWYEQFQFQLNANDILEDDEDDSSYFGAIFEFKHTHESTSTPSPPKYVVAFRGVMLTKHTRYEDMKQSLKLGMHKLEESSRFHIALKAVLDVVNRAGGPENVWLVGHSLGAAIAMLVGKNMAIFGYPLETYLFNPPYISVPIEKFIKIKPLKDGFRIANSIMKAGIAKAMNKHRDDSEEDSFVVLSEWVPYMFVNPSDLLCAEYIGYFEHREKMEEIGYGKIERISTRCTFGSLVCSAIWRDLEPLRVVPTTYMTVNVSPSEDFRQAHGIVQWWQPHFQWQSKLYKFKTTMSSSVSCTLVE
ncbi:hypothetical protein QVD17_15302 [Tagetes erecta]|uniref:Fungal lipase-like domain-containing protein n=1 Tax=Tagetes erecta TaxID=13708 RepID=A0AAD8KVP5_TARER|nr:hypothetical protein QVD17_15302 [Tagetes erecta]